jgi:hypothetical protein
MHVVDERADGGKLLIPADDLERHRRHTDRDRGAQKGNRRS